MATEKRSLSIEAKVTDLASSQFAKMAGNVRQFAGGAIPLFKATAVAFGTIATATAGGFAAFRHYAEELDKIAKVSDKFGITAESLTAIRNGAELAGVSVDQLAAAMKSFEVAVATANAGGAEQSALFQRLGLSAKQFAGDQLNIVDVMSQVAGGMESLGSAADRTAVLVKLFGKSGTDLAPLLKEGSDGIKRMTAEARAAGAVFSRDELHRVEAFNDAWTKLQQSFKALAERIVVELSPAFTLFFDGMSASVRESQTAVREEIGKTLNVLVETYAVLSKVGNGLAFLGESFGVIATALQYVDSAMTLSGKAMDHFGQELHDTGLRLRGYIHDTVSASANIEEMRKTVARLRAEMAKPVPAAPESKGMFGSPEEFKRFEEGMRRMGEEWAKAEGHAAQAGATFSQALMQPGAFAAFQANMEKMRKAWEAHLAQDPWARFNKGATEALNRWRDLAAAMEDAGNRLVDNTLDKLSDAIADGITRVKSWKDAFRDFADSVVRDLTKITTKMLVTSVVRAIMGEGTVTAQATGGVMRGGVTKTTPLRAFANGGVVTQPTFALMGEGRAPAEAFVPLPDGKTIPVSFRGRGGNQAGPAAPPVVNITMHFSSIDPQSTYDLFMANAPAIREAVMQGLASSNQFRGVVKHAVA